MAGFRVFLAGASGAIGRRLTPLQLEEGHRVCGTTRSQAKAEGLRALGVDPMVVDVFDAEALSRVVVSTRPQVVIHQLTDLPHGLDPRLMGDAGVNVRGGIALENWTLKSPPLKGMVLRYGRLYGLEPAPMPQGDQLRFT